MEDENNATTQSQKAWLARIEREERTHSDMRKRGREVEKIFRMDKEEKLYVPLYWSVVGVEHVGVYSNQPVPDVRPRNEDRNLLFLAVASVIRRGLAFCVDHKSFDNAMHRAVDDYLAMGLGTLRIKVDSIINRDTQRVPIMGNIMTPQGPAQQQVGDREEVVESVGDQTIRWEYCPWNRIGWEPCNEFKHCGWIYFRHRMTQLQIKKRFGRTVRASKDDKDRSDPGTWKSMTYDIYEIWDKTNRQVVFFAKNEEDLIEVIEDPLGLVDFWPIPDLMMTNVPSDQLIPQPDYDYIEQYDIEINRLQERRKQLLEQVKAAGAYDQGIEELQGILELEDGEMLAIPNMMQRMAAAGGPDGFIWMAPIQEKLEALRVITDQIREVKAQVDEILGISDIVRGVTAASETATAQEIKGRWVGVRLTRKRETVTYTVKQMMRMMGQLLASHITPENLTRMTQIQITEELQSVMQDDMMMQFVIDIETDSTVAKDEFREKETFQNMLNGVAQFSQAVLPMVQQNQMPATVSSAILSAALKPYTKYNRNLEEALSQLPETTEQMQGLNQQIQQMTQQSQQTQQQLQYWQGMAQMLQQQATEAKAAKEQADARLKDAQKELATAKADEIRGKTPEAALGPAKKLAEINELAERAESYSESNDQGRMN